LAWTLSSSPDSPELLDRLDDWQLCPDPELRRAKGRAFAEDDYYVYLKYFSTFKDFRIAEPGQPRNGGFWVDERLVFEIARQWQMDYEGAVDNVWWNQPRFHFKSELLTKNAACWITLRSPSKTILLLTYKVDGVGLKMFSGIKRELEQNPLIHEHWPDVIPANPEGDCPLWTRTALTVLRPPGPNDPTLMIASIKKPPTSAHNDVIIVDDIEVKETVQSQEEILGTVEDVEDITALQSFDTRKWFVGTIWDGDGPQMRLFRRGYFSRRQGPWSCYGPDGTPVLHSKRFLAKWRREYGNYKFGCQMLGDPPAKGDQYFKVEDVQRYDNSPLEERKGKHVVAFVDPTGGKNQKSDFGCIRIYGLGEDKIHYALDLWVERMTMVAAADLLFGPEPDEEGHIPANRRWMPRQGLIRRWGVKAVYTEDFAVTGWHEYFKRERERRKYRAARFVPLPPKGWQFWPKENRIASLQPMYENEEILYPRDGFGHASQHDPSRDVMQQFFEDRLSKWVMGEKDGGILNDDDLDLEAWLSQPEVRKILRYPVKQEEDEGLPESVKWESPSYVRQEGNLLKVREEWWGR
jgi:hypothetical protein